MPELPDVEVFKRYLDSTALHQPIEGVEVEEPDLLEELSPQSLSQTLISRELIDARCRREDFPDRFLNKRRQEGADCPAGCGGKLETIEVSGRTGDFCPHCQEKQGREKS